ncbi:cytochrome P450 [Hypoxylon sp. FL0543]|nr:cytochrome P450 [Hypoxylon sp. FL0543]
MPTWIYEPMLLIPLRDDFALLSHAYIITGLIIIFLCSRYLSTSTLNRAPLFPVHGYKSIFEPTWLLRARFIFGSKEIIRSGYEIFKEKPFIVRRNDVDITVLPIKYLEEVRFAPASQLSLKEAQVRNMAPQWTDLSFVLESNLHVDALNKKLSPRLGSFLANIRDELDYAWEQDIPQPDDWTVVDIQSIAQKLVARTWARVFIGHPTCRNEEWLRISIDFSINTFLTAVVLRLFPPWMHRFIVYLLPSRYRMMQLISASKRIMSGLMAKHEYNKSMRTRGENILEEETLLNWMLDNGTAEETTIQKMGSLQCFLTLASIHTTSIYITNILFDICAHPEWIPILREEIDNAYEDQEYSRSDFNMKEWLRRFEKLDSFQTESLRFNPPILLGPQRMVMKPYTLRDGTFLPVGCRVAFPGYHHTFDPATMPNPDEFDPMRSYRQRKISISEAKKHHSAQPSMSNLAFGYGSQSCPGRYLASAEAKMVVARLLHEFDIRLPPGKSRPKTWYADENSFMDPWAKLSIRKRQST